MIAIFLKILNMSVTASWLVLCVLLLRFILRNAPKSFRVMLWALVGIRLLIPISFESIYSLIPSTEIFSIKSLYDKDFMQLLTKVLAVCWIFGIAGMLLYALVSYLKIYRKVKEAVFKKDNVWFCDHIESPFILGILFPRIYLPSDMEKKDLKNVVAHERAHLKRRDHWWKPLGFVLLAIHWFNPLLWIAYMLLCKDIELACDEKVLDNKGSGIKKEYSESIINCSVPRQMITACPLAFGELNVESRIQSVLNYKKPSFWMMLAAAVSFIVIATCFLTNPEGEGWQSFHLFKNEVIVGDAYKIENTDIIFGTSKEQIETIKKNISKAANISKEEVDDLLSRVNPSLLWGGKEVYELQTTDKEREKSYFFYPYGYYVASSAAYRDNPHKWSGVIKIAEHTLVKSKENSKEEIIYGKNCFHLRKPTIVAAVGNSTWMRYLTLDGSMKTKYGEDVTTRDTVWMHFTTDKIHAANRKSVEDILPLLNQKLDKRKTGKNVLGTNLGHGAVNVAKGFLDGIYVLDTYEDEYGRSHELRMEFEAHRIVETDERVAGGFLFEYEVYSDLLGSYDEKSFPCVFEYSDTDFQIIENNLFNFK